MTTSIHFMRIYSGAGFLSKAMRVLFSKKNTMVSAIVRRVAPTYRPIVPPISAEINKMYCPKKATFLLDGLNSNVTYLFVLFKTKCI